MRRFLRCIGHQSVIALTIDVGVYLPGLRRLHGTSVPVLCPLHGVTSAREEWLDGSLYVNSAALGKWEEFITHELVAWLDARYRTIAERRRHGDNTIMLDAEARRQFTSIPPAPASSLSPSSARGSAIGTRHSTATT